MKYAAFRELHTDRLVLRKMAESDLKHYFHRLAGSEAVTRYMLFQPHDNIADSEVSIQKWLARYEAGPCYHWVISLKETRELIGIIDLLRIDERTESASFAYMLGQDFWGRGYGTEALKAVFDFAFQDMELRSIEADHMAENVGSGRVMQKAGMVCQGIHPAKYEKNGTFHDAVLYRITRE